MTTTSVSFATYNVLHPHPKNNFNIPNKGLDFNSRVSLIVENILSAGADVVMLQEIDKTNFQTLMKDPRLVSQFTGYHTKHDGQTGSNQVDGVALLYKTNNFKQLNVGTIDRNTHTTTNRRELYVDLQTTTNQIFRCATAHIVGGNRDPGDKQLQETLQYIQKSHAKQTYHIDAYVMGCDLNEEENILRKDGKPNRFKIFTDNKFFTDNNRAPSEIGKSRKIDHLFIKTQQHINPNGKTHSDLPEASDHHLVTSTINLALNNAPAPTPPNNAPNPKPVTPTNSTPPPVASQQPTVSKPKTKPSFGNTLKCFMKRHWKWIVPLSIITGTLALWAIIAGLGIKHLVKK